MSKRLSEYLDHLKGLVVGTSIKSDFAVKSVTNDSRRCRPGSIFVAVSGAKNDGHRFIPAAIAAGAEAIVHENDIVENVPGVSLICVRKSYPAYARLCEVFHDFPASKMTLVGITGTKGKTTTAFLLDAIFSAAGRRCGLITTVCYRYGGKVLAAGRTTPEPGELQEYFAEMVRNGCDCAVMEVSSHALDQDRIGTAKFAGSVFTNLSGDHLDYHKDMESYFAAKKLLFLEHISSEAPAVVNIDNPYGRRLAAEVEGRNFVTFGRKLRAKYRISHMRLSAEKSAFSMRLGRRKTRFKSPLIGEYNVHNAAGAAVLAWSLGVPLPTVAAVLEKGVSVPGRLEKFTTASGINIFVDYAHTDDALDNVLRTLRPQTEERLTVVFGCGGDRDRTKRPRMGAVAAELADKVIVTSDNPRTEDPLDIIREITAGIPRGTNFSEIPDRREAIFDAIRTAGRGDIILIAGKGHEDYQEINGVKHPFDDRAEVAAACKALGKELV